MYFGVIFCMVWCEKCAMCFVRVEHGLLSFSICVIVLDMSVCMFFLLCVDVLVMTSAYGVSCSDADGCDIYIYMLRVCHIEECQFKIGIVFFESCICFEFKD